MPQSHDIYGQIDWWDPRHSLVRMASVKFAYFHEKIGPLEGTRVLDVGCGGGLVAEEFAKRGAQVTGIDRSEAALQTARAHATAGGLDIHYEVASAEEIPFADGLFDAVVCADCLEHVDDVRRVVREVARVLRGGGVFCYDTFNRNFLSKVLVAWILEWLLRREYRRLSGARRAPILHEWSKFIKPEELADLMAPHRLVSREAKGILLVKGGFRVGGRPMIAYIGYATKAGDGVTPCKL